MTGATINLIWDTSVTTSAPAGFMAAVQAAATYLDSIITNPITLNIEVGWNEITQGTVTTPVSAAEGGPDAEAYVPMATLLATLNSKATSSAQIQAWSNISPTLNPNGNGEVALTSAQLDALGLSSYLGGTPAVDGSIGIGSGFTASTWEAAALHEITHALGRISGYAPYGLEDLFRYSAPGVHAYTGGVAGQYFSIDGGVTNLATYSATSDYSDWVGTGTTALDPFDWAYQNGTNGTQLTSVDKTLLNLIGFNIAGTQSIFTAAQAVAAFAANANTAAMVIVDTAANVSSYLDQLQVLTAAGKISSITLSNIAAYVQVIAAQLTSDAATLALIVGPFSLSVNNGAAAYTHVMLGNENTEFVAGTGSAIIIANGLGDFITGGSGNDWIVAGAGADHLDGGAGWNMVSYYNAPTGVTVNLASGIGSGGYAQGDTYANFQGVQGSLAGGNVLIANNAGDQIYGFGGNNTLQGGSGNDLLVGGIGNDTFVYNNVSYGNDEIKNFILGSDHIQISKTVAANFAALTITQSGANSILTFGGGTIQVDNVLATNLSTTNFLFS